MDRLRQASSNVSAKSALSGASAATMKSGRYTGTATTATAHSNATGFGGGGGATGAASTALTSHSSRLYPSNAAGMTSGQGARRSKRKKKEDERRVIDKRTGKDVTPLPLSSSDFISTTASFGGGSGGGGGGNSAMSGDGFGGGSNSSFHASSASLSSMNMSALERDSAANASMDKDSSRNALGDLLKGGGLSGLSNDPDGLDSERGAHDDRETRFRIEDDKSTGAAPEAPIVYLTEQELLTRHSILISETPTFSFFFLPSTRTWEENKEESRKTREENELYEKTKEKKKEKDKFADRGIQTFNATERDKEVQVEPKVTHDAGVGGGAWDIYDCYSQAMSGGAVVAAAIKEEEEKKAEELSAQYEREVEQRDGTVVGADAVGVAGSDDGSASARSGQGSASASGVYGQQQQQQQQSHRSSGSLQSQSTHGASSSYISTSQSELASGAHSSSMSFVASSSSSGSGSGSSSSGPLALPLQAASPLTALFLRPSFIESVRAIEAAVLQNAKLNEQLLYRHHPDEDASGIAAIDLNADHAAEAIDRPHLIPLWTFSCVLVKDLSVTCMSWNRYNNDLLAAGYGSYSFGPSKPGLLLFWSLKNPSHPHKVIRTRSSIVSMDWGTEHPYYLAVGMYDGNVAVYDVRDKSDKPIHESQHATGKHTEPVWGVQWVFKEATGRTQQLNSISSDGTVKQWSMKKGLVPKEIMSLKRIPNKAQFQGSSMEGLSHIASPLCLDFSPTDPTQYYCGTEDGLVHRCSSSYNEQTLSNHHGHTGPVYRLRASPFLADTFLTCSADWTMALWSAKIEQPVIKFQSGWDYVMDIAWSPFNSCVFGNVSRDGRVEVWDMESSPLDPIISHATNMQLCSVSFAPNAPVLLTGSSTGVISVFRVERVDIHDPNRWSVDEQASRLNEIMYTHNESKHKS